MISIKCTSFVSQINQKRGFLVGKKVISFILRILILVIFYIWAYEHLLERSMSALFIVIGVVIVPEIIVFFWRWFKKRRGTPDATK